MIFHSYVKVYQRVRAAEIPGDQTRGCGKFGRGLSHLGFSQEQMIFDVLIETKNYYRKKCHHQSQIISNHCVSADTMGVQATKIHRSIDP